MKICFPTMGHSGLDETIGLEYNRVQYYTILDLKTSEMKFIPGEMIYQYGLRTLSRMLTRAGVEAMSVYTMDPDTRKMFLNAGVHVFEGARGTVKESLRMFLSSRTKHPDYNPPWEQELIVPVQA